MRERNNDAVASWRFHEIMENSVNIQDRKPIWIALSEFYLDNEIQDSGFRYIANTIKKSPFDLDQVKWINKYEVFPVLQKNLLSVAGEWLGFEENWLIDEITTSINKRNKIRTLGLEISYFFHNGMCKPYWSKVEVIYNSMI